MEEIIIRRAELSDVTEIVRLNHELFVLEKENFDPTLMLGWSLSDAGLKYFKNAILQDFVIVAEHRGG